MRARAFVARTLRSTRILVKDERLPGPLRWVAGIALLPIPGPFDEAVMLLVAPILLVFYRQPMRDAWGAAER